MIIIIYTNVVDCEKGNIKIVLLHACSEIYTIHYTYMYSCMIEHRTVNRGDSAAISKLRQFHNPTFGCEVDRQDIQHYTLQLPIEN